MAAEIVRLRGSDPEGPFSVEAEQMVLGLMLTHEDVCAAIDKRGGTALFVEPLHARIFEVAAERERAGLLVSPVTMAAVLEGDEALGSLGGPRYLARMAGAATSVRGLPHYLDLLSDMRSKRQILAALEDARGRIMSGEQSAREIAGSLEGALIGLEPDMNGAGPVSMLKAVTVAMGQISAAYSGDGCAAVRSGIAALDDLVGGFYPGELILLGGRPSMGKTALALSIATRVARAGGSVGIASLEMNPEALAMRALSEATSATGIASSYPFLTNDMVRGNFSNSRLALMEFRRRVQSWQHSVLAFQMCRPVYERFMDTAVLAGAIDLPGYGSDPRAWHLAEWLPTRWAWVDPLKDISAEVAEIEAGLKSRTQAVSERGYDVERLDEEIASEQARAAALGLDFRRPGSPAAAPASDDEGLDPDREADREAERDRE